MVKAGCQHTISAVVIIATVGIGLTAPGKTVSGVGRGAGCQRTTQAGMIATAVGKGRVAQMVAAVSPRRLSEAVPGVVIACEFVAMGRNDGASVREQTQQS